MLFVVISISDLFARPAGRIEKALQNKELYRRIIVIWIWAKSSAMPAPCLAKWRSEQRPLVIPGYHINVAEAAEPAQQPKNVLSRKDEQQWEMWTENSSRICRSMNEHLDQSPSPPSIHPALPAGLPVPGPPFILRWCVHKFNFSTTFPLFPEEE